MKSSNLAERLEEFEATLESLQLTQAPVMNRIVARDAPAPAPQRPVRRARRVGGIQIRDQGLRSFRVC
jgi:hypothetical protein